MRDSLVLQKLLARPAATAIVENGDAQVGGFVTAASAVAGLRTPAELLAAYGIDASPQFVDVVRFEQPRLARLSEQNDAEHSWPDFPSGFLRGDSLAQVWRLERTRYSHGAEYWRMRSDGQQKCLSRYEGSARGWTGAQQWHAPNPLVGNLARWRGGEYFADVIGQLVLLTSVSKQCPAGFAHVHPGVWAAEAPVSECEVFERIFVAELEGIPVRLLASKDRAAEVVLLSSDPSDSARVGAGVIEPGVYELVVDSSRLVNLRGFERQWTGEG